MFKSKRRFQPGKTKILYGGVSFQTKERKAIEKILDQNWWGIGKETEKFEKELAHFNNVKKAIFVNSGSSALLLSFAALNLPAGSEVIVPAVTFPTPISALIYLNLIPVVVDVDITTFNINQLEVEKAINRKTRAILAVHVAGNPADMISITKIAKRYNLYVIEDNCDGFGGSINKKLLGSFGDVATISMHAAHMISTGEGGVVLTSNLDIGTRAKGLRDWGRLNHLEGRNRGKYKQLPNDYSRRYIYDQLGFNLKPIELQAAMGRVQLRRIRDFKQKRAIHYLNLYQIFKQHSDYFDLTTTLPEADPCWYTFAFLIKNHSREKFTNYLNSKKIEWRNILAGNIAKQPAYQNKVKVITPLPNADEVLRRGLWISVHPLLTSQMLKFIEISLANYFTKN